MSAARRTRHGGRTGGCLAQAVTFGLCVAICALAGAVCALACGAGAELASLDGAFVGASIGTFLGAATVAVGAVPRWALR